jgi:hypothetical protein
MNVFSRCTRWAFLAILCVWVPGCMIPVPSVEPITTIEPVEEVRVLQTEGAERARVRLRLLSDQLTIRGGEQPPTLLQGRFRYNVAAWEPNITQETENGETRVTLNQGMGSQIPLGQSKTYQNEWEINLGRGILTDLGVDMGSGTADLALGGLSLTDLSVTAANTDLVLTFDAPNPEPLGLLRLTAGTGKFKASGLGNANFDRVSIMGGAGAVDLDFSGSIQRSAIADVKAGAGKITVRVPGGIGARATVSGSPLRTLDLENFTESGENTYVNSTYGEAPLTLTLRITAGVGKIVLISY